MIDLDGTFVNVNTFHKWMIFLVKRSLVTNFFDTIKLLSYFAMRYAKVITHQQMKHKVLKISEKACYSLHVDTFVQGLEEYINPDVKAFIREDVISILATAAPSLYAKKIAQKYQFTYAISTPSTSHKPWSENIREKKAEALEYLFQSLDTKGCDTLLSDHHDDIYIMRYAKRIYLVNPSEKTEEIVKNEGLSFVKL